MGGYSLKHQAKAMVFATTEMGCFIPLSHKLNPDGYLRKTWGSVSKGRSVTEMFHRFIWRATHGEIPLGFEIDHKCHTRACCNVQHLQCIDGSQHASESNRDRKGFKLWPHTH